MTAVRTDVTRTYPIPVKKGFDYCDDFKTWPAWYVGMSEIIHPEEGRWHEIGDEVRFGYKLLGRHVEGVATLEERREMELVRFRTEVPGLPVFHFAYHYREVDPESFEMMVTMETEEPTSFFGKTIDRMLLPKVIERDLIRSMENLHDVFAAGLLD